MGFIDNIQNKLAKFFINKAEGPERTIKSINLKDAKSVGIVYNASNDETRDLVKRYVKFLRDYKIKTLAIGCFEEKELPLDVNPSLEFDFITKKDLNLHLEPTGVVANNFTEEEFDILIDTSTKETLTIQYLVLKSKASFKVGAQKLSYSSLFDLTIVLKPEEGPRQLMKNIDRYLHVIKN